MLRAIGGQRFWRRVSALALLFAFAAPASPAAAAGPRQTAAASRRQGPSPARQRAKAPPRRAPRPAAKGPTDAAPKPAAPAAVEVVKTEEAGAKGTVYTFGAQEVEGRLKSPQILYFLRRVRAQFDPAPLGHRSFLLELSDTRRHPAFE